MVVVRRLRPVESLSEGWREGPLPVVQHQNATTRRKGALAATDAVARRTLVAQQQADVLYGGRSGHRRVHRILSPPVGGGVVALELLLLGSDDKRNGSGDAGIAMVAAHVVSTDALSPRIDVHSPVMWSEVSHSFPELTKGFGQVRAVHFEEVASDPSSDDALLAAYRAVAGAFDAPAVQLLPRARQHAFSVSRPDWSALVMRDGAAFVAHQSSEESFAPILRTMVHSIHLDSLMLAWLQREMLDRTAARAAQADIGTPADLVDLETRHFDFKRTFWRTSLTDKRTSPTDDVFRAFQHELLTPLDVADVEERVTDGAQLARTLQAERLEALVRTAAIVIGSFTLAFTAAPVISDPSPSLFGWAALAGVVGIAVATLVLLITGRRRGR